MGLETDVSVNFQGILRSSSWVQEWEQNQGKAQATEVTPQIGPTLRKSRDTIKDTVLSKSRRP